VIQNIKNFLIGYGSIILAPMNHLAYPDLRITLPPESALQGIAHDFSAVARNLRHSISKVQDERQLELNLNIPATIP
jgi:hypothetical protein